MEISKVFEIEMQIYRDKKIRVCDKNSIPLFYFRYGLFICSRRGSKIVRLAFFSMQTYYEVYISSEGNCKHEDKATLQKKMTMLYLQQYP